MLELYKGSMGSLTDVMISCANGHEVEDEAAVNAELDRMVHALWERAKDL